MSTFTPHRDQDAWNTIRGYVYQVDLTIERWLNLQPGQTLELECGEDIDIVSRSLTATPEEQQRLLEQVKHRDSSITLKSSEAVTAIACFIDHRQTNPSANLLFRFTTNTEVGKEKLSPMPNKAPAIVAWEQIRQRNLQGTAQNPVLQGIRTILKNVKQPKKLHSDTWQIFCDFITNASDERLLNLIYSFEWSTKAPEAKSLSPSLQKLLIDRKHAKDKIEAQEQYRRLFLYVFKRLCEREKKQLSVKELSNQLSLSTLSETDHQLLNNLLVWFHALEVRVQEHEVRLGVLEQRLDREQAEPYIGQEVADCIDNLLRDYTKLFVGRETILKQLDEFLAEKRTNLLTLIAPAGVGKTALLANWVASRQDDGCFILYHFFSQRYDVTRSFSAAYRNLLRQLYDYYQPSDRQIPNNEDGLRDKLYRLIKEYSAGDGRPLVIVLDALDEAEPPFRQFLPLLPENVFLIASARAEEGQEPEYLRGWTDNALPIRLNRLCRGAIADWIRQAGNGELAAFAEDTHFVAQLDEITQGFPLYLRYLTEELIQAQQKGEDVQVVLTCSPKGFGAYVQEQFKRLAQVEEIRRHREVQELFALLSVALGALSEDDMQELTALNAWDLAALPWQATRWFNIQTGFYSFAHPLLAKEFQGVLKRQASSAKDKLIKYCSRWQEHQRRYALRHYAEHLHEVKRWEELYAIAGKEDFAVAQREHLPNEPDLPLKTVQTALLSAAERDDASAMAEFMLVHARRLRQTTVQESPLDALRKGSLERAWKLADLCEPKFYVLWYLLLAWELKDANELNKAQATLQQLLKKTLPCFPGFGFPHEQTFAAYVLTKICELDEDTFTLLHRRLLDKLDALYTLCQSLSADGHFKIALKTVKEIGNEKKQVRVLNKIAKAYAKTGDKEAARSTFAIALEIARRIDPSLGTDSERNLAEVLMEIATAQAEVGEFDAALHTTQKITRERHKNAALVEIGLAQAQEDMFDAALMTVEIDDLVEVKAIIFGKKAKAQARAGEKKASKASLLDSLQTVRRIKDKNSQVSLIASIAVFQMELGDKDAAQTTLADIYKIAQDTEKKDIQAISQAILAAVLQEIGEEEKSKTTFAAAVDTALEINNSWLQAGVLKGIAESQVEVGQLTDALETIKKISDQRHQAEAQKAIAVGQAKERKFIPALKIAHDIEEKEVGAEALGKIAIEQAKARKFSDALETAQNIDRKHQWILVEIAKEWGQAGDGMQARTTLATALQVNQVIDNSLIKLMTLSNIAVLHMRLGNQQEAQAMLATAREGIQTIEDQLSQVIALNNIGVAQTHIGNEQEAQVTFSAARQTAQRINSQRYQAVALKLLAEAQVEVEDFGAALKTACAITQPGSQANMLEEIAIAQAKRGNFIYAFETVQTIKFEEPRKAAAAAVVDVQAAAKALTQCELGDFAAAIEIVQKIKNPKERVEALTKIAAVQVQKGKSEEAQVTFASALEVAKKTVEKTPGTRVIGVIAITQAEIGKLAEALETVQTINLPSEQAEVLGTIARVQAQKGENEAAKLQFSAALVKAQEIDTEFIRTLTLEAIVKEQVKAGFSNQAVKTAERILYERNWYLPNIAAVLSEVGDKVNFKQLLIPCAYYLDGAYRICGHLVRLYPEQAAAVAKVVSELN